MSLISIHIYINIIYTRDGEGDLSESQHFPPPSVMSYVWTLYSLDVFHPTTITRAVVERDKTNKQTNKQTKNAFHSFILDMIHEVR